MNIREYAEQLEINNLSGYASKSINTKGRSRFIEPCNFRTEFQRDRDRITHSKSFRRLMHKTQVFFSPEGDHYRTRLTHTLEVVQIARTIARALRLNEDLTETIALGHDLGHTPFGHTGEYALNNILSGGFRHNEQSVRVVTKLENAGDGLNLTYEVIDGIYNHRTECRPSTLEGCVVQLSDKIGYINHDIDDAIRSGLLNEKDLPKESIEILGDTSSKRINFLITNIVLNSLDKNEIALEAHVSEALKQLREHMFATVYLSQLQQKERKKIANIMESIYNYYLKNIDKLPNDYLRMINEKGEDVSRVICDYIAGMTDRFAMKVFADMSIPISWNI